MSLCRTLEFLHWVEVMDRFTSCVDPYSSTLNTPQGFVQHVFDTIAEYGPRFPNRMPLLDGFFDRVRIKWTDGTVHEWRSEEIHETFRLDAYMLDRLIESGPELNPYQTYLQLLRWAFETAREADYFDVRSQDPASKVTWGRMLDRAARLSTLLVDHVAEHAEEIKAGLAKDLA